MNQTAPIEWTDLALSGGLVLVAGVVSLGLRLELERKLLVACLRTVIQLSLLGQILDRVFQLDRPIIVVAIMALMGIAAGHAAVGRSRFRYRGVRRDAFVTLVLVGVLTTTVATQAIIQIRPWYAPRYLIPLFGMVLGNSLTGISLSLDAFLEGVRTGAAAVEADLCLGATRWEAAQPLLRESVRRGLVPMLNTLSIAGIVSLPGMMTGQILAGEAPSQAVMYQILIMFMLCASVALGTVLLAMLAYRASFTREHRLRPSSEDAAA